MRQALKCTAIHDCKKDAFSVQVVVIVLCSIWTYPLSYMHSEHNFYRKTILPAHKIIARDQHKKYVDIQERFWS
jgi:hypothetical protein